MISIDDDFKVEFAGVMYVVDDDGHEILEFEGDGAYAIADGDVADFLYLTSDLFEEEVAFVTWNFGKGVAIFVDLMSEGRFWCFHVFVIVLFWFHYM